MKTNTELQRDVLAELTYEPMIDASQIGVIAKDGIVTLTGTVESYAQKLAAAEAAERVLGVRAVVDEIHVDLPCKQHRADEDLGRAVLNALKWDTRVPDERLKFRVNRGWITLEGTVDHRYEREAAEEVIRNLVGVRHIENQIEVRPAITPSDVKTRVENALRRMAPSEPYVSVEVKGSTVILRGNVQSQAERRQAERAAWSVPGVSKVEDHLTIAA